MVYGALGTDLPAFPAATAAVVSSSRCSNFRASGPSYYKCTRSHAGSRYKIVLRVGWVEFDRVG